MIAIDTSSLIAFLEGERGADTDAVEDALGEHIGVLPPPVLTELLSIPKLDQTVTDLFRQIPVLSVSDGYWERTGLLRSRILSRGHKARLADALIAQSCIDHRVPLIARDDDFRHFVRAGGLKLIS